VGLVLIFWSLLLGMHAVGNSDLFWQLKTGQIILENHQVPQTDSFSFTVPGKEWINLEWLACVLFWKVFQWGHFLGLSILSALSVFVLALTLYKLFYKIYDQKWLGLFLVCLVLYLSGNRLQLLRPELYSFIFFSIFIFELWVDASFTFKKLILLALIQVLWVNTHSSFLLGIGLTGLALMERFVRKDWKAVQFFSVVVLVLAGSSLLNPYGLQAFFYPFKHMAAPVTMARVSDWVPLLSAGHFSYLTIWLFLGLCLIAGIGLLFSYRDVPKNLGLILASLYFSFLAFKHQRFVFYAVVVMFVLLGSLSSLKWVREKAGEFFLRVKFLLLGILVVIPLLWARNGWIQGARYNAEQGRLDFILGRSLSVGFDHSAFSWAGGNYLFAYPPKGAVYNSMDLGGYLIFRLWPRNKVFVDTRTPVYGEEFLHQVMGVANKPDELTKLWENLGVKTLVLSKAHLGQNKPLADYLQSQEDWEVGYDDSLMGVWVKKEIW